MLKFILSLSILLIFTSSFSQVSFGKRNVDGSGLVDFADDSSKGIILPLVEVLPTNSTNGTLLALKQDSSIYCRKDNLWVKLSKNGILPTNFINYPSFDKDSTIIGAKSTLASGVLILESNDKALILPKNTSNHIDIINPRIGTIAYDKTLKSIAVFDGRKWIYWY